jgi:gamma-glutamylputrescine oxidase
LHFLFRSEMAQSVYDELTWYDATASRHNSAETLRGAIDCDVCVIGGGLAGLTTCLELKGKSVVLLEAQRIGDGASGRNGGFVYNGFAQGVDEIVDAVGLDAGRELYALSAKGTEYVRSEIAHGDASIMMGKQMILVQRHPDKGALEAHGELLAKQFGENVQNQDQTTTRRQLASTSYHASLLFPDAFHIHPLRYVIQLGETARILGARIFEYCPALNVSKTDTGHTVKTPEGEVQCGTVVHCVSSLDTRIHRPSGRAVLPVMTYVAVTEPLDQDYIRTGAAVVDTRRAGDYYRIVDDGRVLWGGRITTRTSRPHRLAQMMRSTIRATYPGLQYPRIDYAWLGQMGYAIHKMPLIGRDADGQWFATAFGGHGLNTTAMAGILVASAIAEGDDRYRLFTPFAPRWAYGQLGRLGVQGSYWLMQLKDRLDEARV